MEREAVNWRERIARKKLGLSDEWEVCAWEAKWEVCAGEAIGFPPAKDVLVSLGVPRLLKSGKRKGEKTWKDSKDIIKCVVTEAELIAEYAEYERGGKCCACFGTGEELSGWSKAGVKYRPCRRCGATGKPKEEVD